MDARTRLENERKSQPTARAMAEWLFDNGYGHVDEPRFILNGLIFMPLIYCPKTASAFNLNARCCFTVLHTQKKRLPIISHG